MGVSGHLCFLARSLFCHRRSCAQMTDLRLRRMQSRKMRKSGHLCFLARSPFCHRRTHARSTFLGGRSM
eukprot:247230-Ditylum_brightwellii.AAC.1